MNDPTLQFARDLISRRSVTPDDNGCQPLIARRLEVAGFMTEHMRFGEVDNLWATHGTGSPCLVFAGHTDVVPSGPIEAWSSDPFEPQVRDGKLYGRGAADMKSSLAAFVTALEEFVDEYPEHRGSLAVLITSDEEADAVDGTARVMDLLGDRNVKLDYCIVGEPSAGKSLGDTIKVGRRGSLGAQLVVRGIQGHVAYPEFADNPIPRAANLVAALVAMKWDSGNEFFPPTSLQISNVHAGTGTTNVIPGEVVIDFNLRYSTETSKSEIKSRVTNVLAESGADHTIRWQPFGDPFLTKKGELIDAGTTAIREVTGLEPELSTSGGTSDGRFIAPTGAQVIEIGPVNATIHKVDECVSIEAPHQLAAIYRRIMELLLASNP